MDVGKYGFDAIWNATCSAVWGSGVCGLGGTSGGSSGCPTVSGPPPTVGFLPGTGSSWPSLPSLGCAVPQGSAPRCFAQLKYRPSTAPQARGCNHSFWWVQDRTGSRFIVSGGSQYPNGSGDVVVAVDPGDRGRFFRLDTSQRTTHWQTGLSADHCDAVGRLLDAARNFPTGNRYVGYEGPNSNSAARYLGFRANFGVRSLTSPPDACGWDASIF